MYVYSDLLQLNDHLITLTKYPDMYKKSETVACNYFLSYFSVLDGSTSS